MTAGREKPQRWETGAQAVPRGVMLLCDLTGDTKVSGQRWVPWDRGGGGSPLSHWGPHLLYICWDFLFQLSCACLDDRNGHTDAGLDFVFQNCIDHEFRCVE